MRHIRLSIGNFSNVINVNFIVHIVLLLHHHYWFQSFYATLQRILDQYLHCRPLL